MPSRNCRSGPSSSQRTRPYSSYRTPAPDDTENLVSPLLALDDTKTNSNGTLDTVSSSNSGGEQPLRRRNHGGGSGAGNNNESVQTQRSTQSSTTNTTTTLRILDRTGRFHQSRGRWSVDSTRPHRSRRCWDDWFHSLAYTPTLYLMMIVFVLYFLTIIFFAFVYLLVSTLGTKHTIVADDGTVTHESYCGMQISNVMEAMYFSLSTMTTLGYAISDYYFGDCWTPFLLVLIQIFSGIIFDAVAVGLLFQRMSRGQKRGRTIIFSDKAVVRRVGGVPYFMFRVGELRKRHIIEARVRVYCVRHERYPVERRFLQRGGYHHQQHGQGRRNSLCASTPSSSLVSTPRQRGDGTQSTQELQSINDDVYIETSHYVTHPVKLHPDEDLATNILMSLPHLVVHKMDESSPLIPTSPVWYDVDGNGHSWNHDNLQNEDVTIGSKKADTNTGTIAMIDKNNVTAINKEDELKNATTAPSMTSSANNENGLEGFIIKAKTKSTASIDIPSDNSHDNDHHVEIPALEQQRQQSINTSVSKENKDDSALEATTYLPPPPVSPPPPYETANSNVEQYNPNNNGPIQQQEKEGYQPYTRLMQFAKEHDEIFRFLSDRDSELIVLVEGTDEMTGSSVQARHSYRIDDILFDHAFVNCISPRVVIREEYMEEGGESEEGGIDAEELGRLEQGEGVQHRCTRRRGTALWKRLKQCLPCCACHQTSGTTSHTHNAREYGSAAMSLDFEKFHDVVPAPLDCEYCPFVNIS